jgi:SAM-dependent methyltransferase
MTTASIYDTATALNPSIKAKQQAMWASGDFAVIGTTLQIVGEVLCETIDLRSTERVLDVAAGNGNATLAAARRFETADAEALPYQDRSFDVVLSTFGVMFAPDHQRSAGELLRVTRPGGRIGLASWTPSGFLGDLFRTVAKHVPPPAGVASPLLWGTAEHLRELFPNVTTIQHATRSFAFRYQSPEHFLDVFRRFYGPVLKAFAALDANGQSALETDLLALLRRADRGGAAGLVVRADYLETVITR